MGRGVIAMEKTSFMKRLITRLVLLLFVLAILLPVSWVVLMSFQPTNDVVVPSLKNLTLKNYDEIILGKPLKRPREIKKTVTITLSDGTVTTTRKVVKVITRKPSTFMRAFWTSVKIATLTVIITLFVASMTAYGFSRYEFPGKFLFYFYYMVSQMFPAMVGMIALYVVFVKLGLTSAKPFLGMPKVHWALVIAYTGFNLPFAVWNLRAFMDAIPRELDEAAMVDGASPWTIYWKIIVPLSLPGLAVTGLFAFMGAWLEYVMALILISSNTLATLPLWMYNLLYVGSYGLNITKFAAASVLVAVPVTVVFLAFQKYLLSGLLKGSVKG
ncbi:ABC transporter permease subunit [bacterium 3DAC]|nr:ABC transporter permease subunit [bacterium 3DAC]